MNQKHDLLALFNGVEDRFVVEAMESSRSARPAPGKRRMMLIAAIVAVGLLLMGSTWVIYRLQQRTVGEISVTEPFDDYGISVSEPEKIWHVASLSGFQNSPEQLASGEWFAFRQSHRPENLTNTLDLPDIPNHYEYSYGCYDRVMVDKLDEIAEKYDLELLGTCVLAQAWQQDVAFEALGISHLVSADAPAKAEYGACLIYPPYNFRWDVLLTAEEGWKEEVLCEVNYLQAGYLAADDLYFYDPEDTREWEYTAADGTKVLLALSGKEGLVLAQQETHTIVIFMDLAWKQGVFLDPGTDLPAPEDLEQLADCFDYTVAPGPVAETGLQEKLDAVADPNAGSPEEFPQNAYASYGEYLQAQYFWPEQVVYAFYDIDGDGEKDLITSYGDGFCIDWLTVRDGEVINLSQGRGAMQLCESGIVQTRDPGMYQYLYDELQASDGENGLSMTQIHSVRSGDGQWNIDGKPASSQEVEDFMAQFPPVKLDWKPLADFPVDDKGTTFAEKIAREEIPAEDLKQFYSSNVDTSGYPWFALQDINGDGVKDLLLSQNGELVDLAFTCKQGKLLSLGTSFYLCKDSVMHTVETVDRYSEGVLERNRFTKIAGQKQNFYVQLTHNLSTGIWTDTGYREIPEEAAEEILEQYAHETLNMRPIAELTGS